VAHQVFELIAQLIPNLKSVDEVQQCSAKLKGEKSPSTITSLVPKLTTDQISIVDSECNWSRAKAQVN